MEPTYISRILDPNGVKPSEAGEPKHYDDQFTPVSKVISEAAGIKIPVWYFRNRTGYYQGSGLFRFAIQKTHEYGDISLSQDQTNCGSILGHSLGYLTKKGAEHISPLLREVMRATGHNTITLSAKETQAKYLCGSDEGWRVGRVTRSARDGQHHIYYMTFTPFPDQDKALPKWGRA